MNAEITEMLSSAISEGIIDVEQIRQAYNMKKKEEYISRHPNAIYQGKDGKWYTYIGTGKERRKIRRNTKKQLEDYVAQYYESKEVDPTLVETFNMWLDEKLYTYSDISHQSYTKYRNDFKRFFLENEMAKDIRENKLRYISEEELEDFLRKTIASMKLSRKTFSGLITLVNGIFRYGKKHKFTDLSITNFKGDFLISKKSFKVNVKDKDEVIFTEDETATIVSELKKSSDIRDLAILFLFETGLRVGELAALKPQDAHNDYVSVCRTEVHFKDETGKNAVIIQDFPKTESGYRKVMLGAEGVNTLKKILEISKDKEFLFMDGDKRIREHGHRKHLYDICDRLHIKRKSPHKIRRAYGTMLIDAGVDDSTVQAQMGHKDIMTTRSYYYFSNKNEEKIKQQIKKAVNI